MIRFLLLSIFLWSCAENNQSEAPANSISMIISSDSVIIYSGPLKKNTAYQEIPLDEMRVKAILAKEKTKAGEELSVLLKLSHKLMETGGAGGGMMEPISILKNWSIESGITNIVFADMDAMDEAVFKLEPITWAMIDSFRRPHKLTLMMPKDVPEEAKISNENNALTVILLSEKESWSYTGSDYGSGRSYSMEDFEQLLKKKKKELGDSLTVIIKPAESTSYKAVVAMLDQMTIHDIKKYAMVKLSKEEERFINSPDAFEPPPPVKITAPGSVTEEEIPIDNAFVIEIRKDNSVWYQPISPLIKMAPQKVGTPITKNLKDIIADYQRSSSGKKIKYLIKGDGKTSYKSFEQVVNALKENNIHKYNLVTSEN